MPKAVSCFHMSGRRDECLQLEKRKLFIKSPACLEWIERYHHYFDRISNCLSSGSCSPCQLALVTDVWLIYEGQLSTSVAPKIFVQKRQELKKIQLRTNSSIMHENCHIIFLLLDSRFLRTLAFSVAFPWDVQNFILARWIVPQWKKKIINENPLAVHGWASVGDVNVLSGYEKNYYLLGNTMPKATELIGLTTVARFLFV